MDKNKNVFINCPYDSKYKGLLYAILFVIIVFGYEPRLALETSDSGKNRIDKIMRFIADSKYSIHDLSRCVSTEAGEYYRLNMPLELGIDYGCRHLYKEKFGEKLFLILEEKQYSFQKSLSDLSGIDLKAHNNNGAKVVECVRNWFAETVGLRLLPSPNVIFSDYTEDFHVFFLEKAKLMGYKESDYMDSLTVSEYMDFIKEWKKANAKYSKILPLTSSLVQEISNSPIENNQIG